MLVVGIIDILQKQNVMSNSYFELSHCFIQLTSSKYLKESDMTEHPHSPQKQKWRSNVMQQCLVAYLMLLGSQPHDSMFHFYTWNTLDIDFFFYAEFQGILFPISEPINPEPSLKSHSFPLHCPYYHKSDNSLCVCMSF